MNLVKREAIAAYHRTTDANNASPSRSMPSPPPQTALPSEDDLTRLRQLAEIAASRGHLLLSSLFYPAASSSFLRATASVGAYPPSSESPSPPPTSSPPPPQESPIDLRVVKCRQLDWAMERRDSVESNRFVCRNFAKTRKISQKNYSA